MKVVTDLYTKVILTIIALCLLFNIIRDIRVIPDTYAQTNSVSNQAPIIAPVDNKLRTNSDGSINVRLVAADVMEVKPAYGATFSVEPKSGNTRFSVEPYSSSTKFTVEPSSYSSNYFKVEPANNAVFGVKPANSNASFKVEPSSGAVFTVREQAISSLIDEEKFPTMHVYPNPARTELYIEYEYQPSDSKFITVYNINGVLVDKKPIDTGTEKQILDVRNYSPGTYIYTLGKKAGKFIVQH